jgi:hypothetical protein
MLPEDFVASASARDWKVPPVDHVGAIMTPVLWYSGREVPPRDQIAPRVSYKVDHSFWLGWGKGLPNVPEEQSPPDLRVLERFCLTIQEPETDDYDPQMNEFEKTVWDKVRQKYGRFEMALGNSYFDIEWVSVMHRDSVVAQVLDGLRRSGLIDRVKLICSEPDPNDWQRDRHIAVWPPEGAETKYGLHSS